MNKVQKLIALGQEIESKHFESSYDLENDPEIIAKIKQILNNMNINITELHSISESLLKRGEEQLDSNTSSYDLGVQLHKFVKQYVQLFRGLK